MARYARGDDTAFGEVYDAIAPRLHCYIRRRCPRSERAEDLLQQTFLHLHRARGTFIPGACVLPWAFAIARRLLIDLSRRERRATLVGLDADGMPEPKASDPTQDDVVAGLETESCLQAAFDRLPATQREAFDLVKRDGLSFREAAEVLGTTVAGAKLRAQRAYDALRAALANRSAARAQP